MVNVELTDGSTARERRPTWVGALLGKVAAVTQIVAQTSAERAKRCEMSTLELSDSVQHQTTRTVAGDRF